MGLYLYSTQEITNNNDVTIQLKQCIDFAINAKPQSRFIPKNKNSFKYKLWRVIQSKKFDYFIMLLIALNTIVLMMKFYGQSENFKTILSYLNAGFTALFTLECILKLIGFGIRALPYVCLLILMLFFIYAIVGMQIFGTIKLDSSTAINRNNNFRSFFASLLLLFRSSTGEAWPQIMLSSLSGRPCDPDSLQPTDTQETADSGCGTDIAYVYFVTFVFLSTFLMLNLFIAVIMDNFEYLTRDSSILGAHHLDEFVRVWSSYDPEASGRIHYTDVYEMLKNMEPPVGFGKKCPYRLAYRKLIRMNMPVDENGTVHFTTTLFALIRECLSIKMGPAETMNKKDEEMRETLRKLWPVQTKKILNLMVPQNDELEEGKMTVGKIYAGLLITDNWKSFKANKNVANLIKMRPSLFQRLIGRRKSSARSIQSFQSHRSDEVNSGSNSGHSIDKGHDSGRNQSNSFLRRNSSIRWSKREDHRDQSNVQAHHRPPQGGYVNMSFIPDDFNNNSQAVPYYIQPRTDFAGRLRPTQTSFTVGRVEYAKSPLGASSPFVSPRASPLPMLRYDLDRRKRFGITDDSTSSSSPTSQVRSRQKLRQIKTQPVRHMGDSGFYGSTSLETRSRSQSPDLVASPPLKRGSGNLALNSYGLSASPAAGKRRRRLPEAPSSISSSRSGTTTSSSSSRQLIMNLSEPHYNIAAADTPSRLGGINAQKYSESSSHSTKPLHITRPVTRTATGPLLKTSEPYRTSSYPQKEMVSSEQFNRVSKDPRPLPRPSVRSSVPGSAAKPSDNHSPHGQLRGSPARSTGRKLPIPRVEKPEKYEMRTDSQTALQEDSDEDDNDWC
ncbi:hypothetical protein Btru_058404 [Bulinus truncatus]|nr:hypothetical protein Btru_058404 [Bulinus truncatus]